MGSNALGHICSRDGGARRVATAGYASCEPPARLIPPGLPPGRNLVDDPAFAEAPWLRTCDNPENVDALRGVSQDAYKRGPRQQAAQKRISREFFDQATCAFHGARLVSPRGCFPARAGSVVERSGATLRFSFSGAALAACRVGEPSTFRVRYEATAATWFPRGSQGSRPLSITARLRSNSTTTIATLRRRRPLLAGSFEGRFVAPSAGARCSSSLSWLVDEPRPLPRPGAFRAQLLRGRHDASISRREQRPSCATPGAAAPRRAAGSRSRCARGRWHADATMAADSTACIHLRRGAPQRRMDLPASCMCPAVCFVNDAVRRRGRAAVPHERARRLGGDVGRQPGPRTLDEHGGTLLWRE